MKDQYIKTLLIVFLLLSFSSNSFANLNTENELGGSDYSELDFKSYSTRECIFDKRQKVYRYLAPTHEGKSMRNPIIPEEQIISYNCRKTRVSEEVIERSYASLSEKEENKSQCANTCHEDYLVCLYTDDSSICRPKYFDCANKCGY